MIRILLVDDELLVRISLRQLIPWMEYGYEIVGEADNGNSALELFDQLQPDAVFTDIRMPGMDGLTLIQKLKQQSPHTPICILSSHTDFNLVQQGIHYGIHDYIDKLNLTSQEMIDCLDRLKQHVLAIRSDNADRKQMKLQAEISPQSWMEKVKRNEMSDSPWIWMIGEIHESSPTGWNDAELALRQAYPRAIGQRRFFLDSMQRIHCVLAVSSESPDLISSCFESITCSFATSLPVVRVDDWMSAYQQADDTLTDLFYRGWNQLFHYKNKADYEQEVPFFEKEQEDMALQMFRAKQKQQLLDLLTDVFNKAESDQVHPKRVKQKITMFLFRILNEMKWEAEQKQFWGDHFEQKPRLRTKEEVLSWLDSELDQMLLSLKTARYSPEVNKVITYMEAHYATKITLQQLADHVHLNANYLVRIFKEQTEQPPMSYLTSLRIEKAKLLLVDGILPINHVADKVGFINLSHFSRLFKKMVGVSPKEYRS